MARLSTANNFLEALIGAGADAQSNLYEVTFTGGILTDYSENLSVRCSGFNPPEYEQQTYPVQYITAKIDRPIAKIDRERKFDLTFRVDSNLEMYNALLKQQSLTFNAVKHFTATDIGALANADLLFDVHVNYISDSIVPTEDNSVPVSELYSFENCWIDKIDTIKFDSSNSKAVEVQVSIRYLRDKNILGLESSFT